MIWPELREELDLLPGPSLPDGQPSWTLHDPVRNLFFRVEWPTLEVLQRWHLADVQLIAQEISQDTPLSMTPDDVRQVMQFLVQHQMVKASMPDAPRKMAEQWRRIQGTPLKWLLHHYLFFRIPLIRPDAWLTRWLPVARWFGSRAFAAMTLVALVLGLAQVVRRWDVFTASLVDTFNFEGLLSYGLALVCVKCLHELGHAFTAKHHGCRVPAMGVAFLVMWPVAYTDTNEVWRLTRRWDRLRVASAGILTELVIAAWATLAWALLPQGSAQNAAFVLATTSWVATLAINASPFMRFDGYFMLMDALDMPNLHGRSFALARWKLREWLFALGDEPPEHFAPSRQAAWIAFAWATWLYRLVLFIGIAILVYTYFFKALGIVLFAVEILWFVLLPMRTELRVWLERWPDIRRTGQSRRSAWVLVVLLGVLCVPWPGRIGASGILLPVDAWPVYAPAGSMVQQLPAAHGEWVAEQSPLLLLDVPELAGREQALAARLAQQRWLTASSGFDEELRKRWLVSGQTLATSESEWQGLQAERSQFQPLAPYEGRFYWVDPDLAVGQWVGKKEPLGVLVKANTRWRVETWLDEDDVARVEVGQPARFWPDSGAVGRIDLKVVAVDRDASRTLPRKELSSVLGGHILTREKNGQWVPERAIYRVSLEVQALPASWAQQSWRGHLVIDGAWSVPMERYARQVLSVLVREAGW